MMKRLMNVVQQRVESLRMQLLDFYGHRVSTAQGRHV